MIDVPNAIELHPTGLRAAQPTLPRQRGSFDRFGDVFVGALNRPQQSEARVAASQLVASAFIEPALASLREGTFAEPPFAAGFVERRFAPLLDRHIADRITASANFPLVDLIVRRLTQEPDDGTR